MEPTFIVSTGRCGSTMLSNLINQHPDILSLSEFFVFVADIGGYFSETFTSESLDGSEFWDLIAGIKPRMNTLLHNDIVIPEILYPLESATAKFSAKTGVPPDPTNHPTSSDGKS